MELLRKVFDAMPPAEAEDIMSRFKPIRFSRNELLLEKGQQCNRIIFLLKGCSRVYTFNDDLKENILYFGFEGWWMGDVESFFNRLPSRLNIQAMEDCESATISYDDFTYVTGKYEKFREGYMERVRNNLAAMIQRMNEERMLSPEERYKLIMEKQPHILQRIPQRYIALYLGIEPPSLSRIRKRLSEK